MIANFAIRYVAPDGTFTTEGLVLLAGLSARLETLERKMAAIAVIAAPSGGATVDTEARAAISAIIAA